MDTAEEKIINLASKYEFLIEENKKLWAEVTELRKNQNAVNETLARIDEGNKSILEKIDILSENWKKFDDMQKENANKIKVSLITDTIKWICGLAVLGFIAKYILMGGK